MKTRLGSTGWERIKRCDKCDHTIALGEGTSLHALKTHQNGNQCADDLQKKGRTTSRQTVLNFLKCEPPASILPAEAQSVIEIRDDSLSPSLRPVAALQIHDPIPDPLQFPLAHHYIQQGLCPGVKLVLPESTFLCYPFQLHATENMSYNIECISSIGELHLADLVRVKTEEMNDAKLQENNLDLQRLVLDLGGPKLCYALSKALNLPSVRTVQLKGVFPDIRCCVAFPDSKEIKANLHSIHKTCVFWNDETALPKCGFSLLIDEIAIEHRPSLGTMVDALQEGTLTRATEAIVTAIAPFHPEFYTPASLMISGTLKHETDPKQTEWIRMIVRTWKELPDGEAFYGPLWFIASDGDETATCTHSWEVMNLQCGKNNLTVDFNYKHKFKNFASLLQSVSGILVAGSHLKALSGMDSTRPDALFNNKDHMDIKNAVALHSALYKFSICTDLDKCEPEDIPIALLGHLCGFLMRPFIVPTTTLSEQLISLSSAAHMFFILFHANCTSFCPGQLYYNVQLMIKNAYWSIAKQKLLNPDGVLHIGLLGKDRLEGLYGHYCSKDQYSTAVSEGFDHCRNLLHLRKTSGMGPGP
ncbi:hypothetical protein K438DRAFT_1929382 [Mycena galopus ATCC 62051]|nr:hypothetical protein K438DRAFT_1929382 [Mycena galopus ATCC 62051]